MSFERGNYGYSKSAEKLASSFERKTYAFDDFNGKISDKIVNMGKNKGMLSTLSLPQKRSENVISDELTGTGAIKAICREGEITVMRIGNSAYAMTQSNSLVLISANCFSGARTTIFYMDGDYYATDETRIMKITPELTTSYISVSTPLIYTNVPASGTVSTINETPNALSPYVKVRFKISSQTTKLTVPSSIEVESIESLNWASNNVSIAKTKYSLAKSGGVASINITQGVAADVVATIKLGYTSDDTKFSMNMVDDSMKAILYSPISFTIAQNTSDFKSLTGTLGGDTKLYVTKLNTFNKIDLGTTEVFDLDMIPNAMLPYADGYMLFADKRIMFIKVDFDGTNVSIEKNIIRRDFGCDMPRSAVAIDDKIFFGNSCGGIFYLNKFGYTEKDCSCQISAAIDEKLLSHGEDELAGAVAAVTGTRYIITVGEDTYMWHFSDELPSNVTEPAEKREKYSWSELDFIKASDYILTEGEMIYYIDVTDSDVYFFDALKYADDDDIVYSCFESNDMDFDSNAEKVITKINIAALPSDDLTVNVYYDGAPAKSTYTVSPLDFETVCTYCVKPERHKCRNVKIKISGEKPFSLDSVSFEYFETGR
ncbi:MAG: hypothetical protein KBS59_08475 [Clostridiales bacterium]|nr:hypothetical protein [Clostridiales bacterium]